MSMLFANGWAGWLVPLAFIVIGVIANALKSMNEAKPQQQQQRRRPMPTGAPRPGRPNPQSELEKFLEDLGVKKPEQALPADKPTAALPRPPAPLSRPLVRESPERPPARRGNRPQPPTAKRPYPKRPVEPLPADDDVHRATVSTRHLVSTLKDRHAEAIQPSIEQQHLVSSVAKRTVVGADLATAKPAVAVAARTTGDRTAMQLLVGGDMLTRSFMISEVFGPPLSLRGNRF